MARILRYTIAGLIGAFLAWLPMEVFGILPRPGQAAGTGQTLLIGLISGLLIGLFLGLSEAASGLSPRDAGKCILMGALVGAGGGMLGLVFGNAIYGSILASAGGPGIYQQQLPAGVPAAAQPASAPSLLKFLMLLIGRGAGWALIGACIGVSQGIATGSTKKLNNGLIGGFIGGGIGGSLFEILVWLNIGGLFLIRFISFEVTGAAIGLFIGFAEELTKRAWLVRLIGRNEGKEHEIIKARTVIGRSEFADIPIFDDPDIVERHAVITALEKRHYIEDMGSFSGTMLNSAKVTDKQQLRDGDSIQVGMTKFTFRDKGTARFTASGSSSPSARIPTSQHICQFCGAVKDANGNCDCTVGAPTDPFAQPSAGASRQPPPMNQTAPITPQPDTAGQGARLVAVAGPYSGKTFVLKSDETQIGRESTKDIGLPMDNTVSRNHAKVAREMAGWVLYDTGSTNGTYANGAKITQHDLRTGDLVQIGSTKFKFEENS